MRKYLPAKIETKWQRKWQKSGLYKTDNSSQKPKFYCLDMFPYPSGDGLHVGHFKGYVATDVLSRYYRMKGFNVLHPIGWDAFGLPAENYAIRTGTHPAIITRQAISKIKKQMKAAGLSYDWSREINTTDPNYYKWTQWIFLKFFEKGLAYEAVVPINFCPSCKTGLANEEVVNGKCERCGTNVVKKDLRQWILTITKYADRLLEDLEGLDWPESIIEMQRNWIGRSEGALIKFEIHRFFAGSKKELKIKNKPLGQIEVFTTRPDTLFGATYLVIAPEHSIIERLKPYLINYDEVAHYVDWAKQKSDLERQEFKEKTGVELIGIKAINPINGEKLPVFTSDYVLISYGTGAIMAVPAHDSRDFEFAQKFNLPIVEVIRPDSEVNLNPRVLKEAYEGDGTLVNSGSFTGLPSLQAKSAIVDELSRLGLAKKAVSYKLRDWIFSRQRYWGEPIPLVFCSNCAARIRRNKSKVKAEFSQGELLNPGWIALPEKNLPLLLPKVSSYQPTGTGESPLAAIKEWVQTNCPKCSGPARRETNTMPQWAGSCWYYLRYLDPENNSLPFSPNAEKYWMPVDWYVGGAEHAVLHLLYARFWHKFLYDLGLVSTKEPFRKLRNVGLVLAPGGQKMSKSKGNVVTPDAIYQEYGADTLRLYELFMGPFNQSIAWDPTSIEGIYRFLNKVWQLVNMTAKYKRFNYSDNKINVSINRLIEKVENDIIGMRFNTAISKMMEFVNLIYRKSNQVGIQTVEKFLLILAPFAPHITEELWSILGKEYSIHQQKWPVFNKKLTEIEEVTVVVQINGKLRDKFIIKSGQRKELLKKMALSLEKIKILLKGEKIKKIVVVPDKVVNIVTR